MPFLTLNSFYYLAIIAVLLASIMACFERSGWIFDLLVHWRYLYLFLGGITLILGCFDRNYGLTALSIAVLALNIGFISLNSPKNMIYDPKTPKNIRILSFNLWFSNQNRQKTAQYLLGTQADLLILIEATPSWRDVLLQSDLTVQYPYIIEQPDRDRSHMMIFSKLPPESHDLIDLPFSSRSPAMQIRFHKDGQSFNVIGLHTTSPISPDYYQAREDQLRLIADHIKQQTLPTVIAGDFNATPWNHSMRDFAAITGLRRAESNRWIPKSTWLIGWPFFGLPIDHIYAPADWRLTHHQIDPYIGSDHRPVIADLSFAAQQ